MHSKQAQRGIATIESNCEGAHAASKSNVSNQDRVTFPQHDDINQITIFFCEANDDRSVGQTGNFSYAGPCRTTSNGKKGRKGLSGTLTQTTAVLITIVMMFVITHSFRLAINMYTIIDNGSMKGDGFARCHILGR